MKKYLIWVLLISLIVFRYFTTRPVYKTGDHVRITTTIYSDPVMYPTSVYIRIVGLKTYLPSSSLISYGDRVVVEGIVDGDRLNKPVLKKVTTSKNLAVNFRNKIVDFYLNNLPQPESGLLAGVVLGSKSALTSDFYNKTKLTGVTHVVVASGTNITFLVTFLIGTLTLFMPRKRAIPFVIFGIILYLFVSGFEAPLIRAAIMSGFLFVGQESGRVTLSWRIFFLTGAIMLIARPDWLGDIGFILSFVSTGSLMLFERRINIKLLRVPRILREGLSTSLAAQIGVAPILFVTFGQFNILSPIINALVLWTVPFVMVLGALGGVIGLILPILGRLILYLCYPFLWWFVWVVGM